MKTETFVQGYVRRGHTKATVKHSQDQSALCGLIVIAAVILMLAWPVVLATALVLSGVALSKRLTKPVTVEPEATPVKAKRGYHKRLHVNHYQHGKVAL